MRAASATLVWLLSVTTAVPKASAEPASDRERARIQFDRGVELARHGDLDHAISAFEDAYAASPHFSVLYNLAQAYAALGKAVEAASAFERYLDLAGNAISAPARSEVQGLLARQRRRIGWLKVRVTEPGAQVRINGAAPLSPRQEAVPLTTGRYGVTVLADGFAAHVEEVQVAAGATLELNVALVPDSNRVRARPLGPVTITCAVPAVEVLIDGARVGVTPLATPHFLPAGAHEVSFRRPGYRFTSKRVELSDQAPQQLDCRARLDRETTSPTGLLRIRTAPNARVFVDGALHGGEPLPEGPHHVQVTLANHRPWSRDVVVESGAQAPLVVALEPTSEYQLMHRERERRQRQWALGLGAGGLVLAGSAVATFVWNSGRYRDWREQSDANDQALATPPVNAATVQNNSRLRARVADLRAADDLALGLAVSAGAFALTAAVLWMLGSSNSPAASAGGVAW